MVSVVLCVCLGWGTGGFGGWELQPKIMAKAMPPMPMKGANLGVRSSVSSAMFAGGCVREDGWAIDTAEVKRKVVVVPA